MAEKKDKTKNLLPAWEKGQSGNPKGRTRKPLSAIIKQYTDAGVEKPTKAEIIDTIAISFNLTKDDLVDIAKDENASMAARHLARMLLTTGKEGARNFMQLFETLHGKPFTQLPEDAADNELKITIINKTDDPEII